MEYVINYTGEDQQVVQELLAIQRSIAELNRLSLQVSNTEPEKPREGQMYLADGTNWDPLSTGVKSPVIYSGGAWAALGGGSGTVGPQGPAGADGTNGTDGALWFTGIGAPTPSVPAGVKVGDFYLNESNGNYYEVTSIGPVVWTLRGSLLGAAGNNGLDGVDAVNGVVTNDAHVVQAANDGTGYTLSGSGGTFYVFQGITEVNASSTFEVLGSATLNGLSIAINLDGVYTLSGANWTNDQETFTLRATYNGVIIDKDYTIAKARSGSTGNTGSNGVNGSSPVSGFLTNETHVVAAEADGTGYNLGASGGVLKVFEGITQVTSSIVFSIVGASTKNGLTISVNAGTGAYTLSGTVWTSDIETFTIRGSYSGILVDKDYTIAKAKKGTQGNSGDPGSNALNIGRLMNRLDQWYGNPAQTIPLDSKWSVINTGIAAWPSALQNTDGDGSSTAAFSERISLDITKKHRVSIRARQPSGTQTAYYLVAFYDSAGANIGGTGNAVNWEGQGTYFYWGRINEVLPSDWTTEQYEFGGDALAEIPPNAVSMAIGVLGGFSGSDATIQQFQDLYVVELSDDGLDSVIGFLTNQAHVVAAANTGSGYDLAGSGGQFEVFEGITEVTSSATFAVLGAATKNGLTIAIDANGAYSLSGAAWTTESEDFTLRSNYNGIILDAVYSISKSTAGLDSTTASLTASVFVVNSAATGEGYNLAGVGGAHKVISGTTDVTNSTTYNIVGGAGSGGFSTLTKNGLTVSLNASTGVYTTSAPDDSWTSNGESFEFRAVYQGIDLRNTFIVAKAPAGFNGPSGTGKVVTLSGGNATHAATPTARAGFRFNSDGTVVRRQGSVYTQISPTTDWITPRDSPQEPYWVRATVLSGNVIGSALNTWIATGSDPEWYTESTGASVENATYIVEIADNSSGSPVLAFGTYTTEANSLP